MAIPLCLQSHVVIGFHSFLLVVVSILAFYVLSLRNWLGNRKFNVAQGDLCGIL